MSRKLLILVVGLLALVILPFLAWNGLVQQGNASAFDMLLRLSPSRHSAARNNVVLLAIDDETVSRYGPLPLDRALLAEALKRVASAEPKVLVVDMLLSERTRPAADANLADALSRFPKVVLATALEATQDGKPSRWITPLPEFQQHAFALGHVHLEPDRDGVARTLLLTKSDGENRYWALGFEAFRAALGVREPPTEYAKQVRVGDHRIPAADTNGRLMWIHYDGPEGTFPRVSLASVLDGRTPASAFAGKIVILGVTAQGAGDRFYSPFSTGLGMSGIEIHANILSTLLDGAYLSPLGPVSELLFLVAIAAPVVMAAWWRSGRLLAPVAIGEFVVIPVFSYWMLRTGVIVPIASGLVTQVAATLVCFLVQTRFIRRRLGEAIVGRQDYAFRLQAVAHEIKTPLTAIDASSQLMTEADVPEYEERRNRRTHSQGSRASFRSRYYLPRCGTHLGRRVETAASNGSNFLRCVAEASERAGLLAMKKSIAIEQDLDPVVVPADAELLQFAIYNLLVNADQVQPERNFDPNYAAIRSARAPVSVADQGCGIEPAEQKHIFERFYRTKKHRDNREQGSGVGLALVKEIVTQHGGRIEVESEPGKGSSFSVFLPT